MKFIEFLKQIFAKAVPIEVVFKSVAQGLDDLGLTNEERAKGTAEFVKETLSENTERSKARRTVAKIMMYNYILIFWVAVISLFFNAEISKSIIQIIEAFNLGYAFFAIIAFYFGGYYLGKINIKKK